MSEHRIPGTEAETGLPAACPCGHDSIAVPETDDAAMELSRDRYREQLELVEFNQDRFVGVYRCRLCGCFWAERSFDSGHVFAFYVHPIHTDDPHAWIAHSEDLRLRPRSWRG
ncbi:hypothetical protein KRMM14A1259_02720 [Krasilnikovia sp. MM14-A1259]